MALISPRIRILFVDDGSNDGTLDLLHQTAHQVNASVLALGDNAGKSEAVRQGMIWAIDHGAGAIGFVDADGAFPPSEPLRNLQVLQALEGIEAVWSSRVALAGRDIKRRPARHYLGRIMATYVSRGQHAAPYDTQSGLKWFARTDDLSTALVTPFKTRWLFEVELLARYVTFRQNPLRIWEEPTLKWRDVSGSSITFREMARIGQESMVARRMYAQARKIS